MNDIKTWKNLLLTGMAVLCMAACSSDNEDVVPEPEPEPTVPPLVTDYQDPMFENFECYPEGTVWEVMYTDDLDENPDYCIIYRYEVKGDTTINNIKYKKVLGNIVRCDTIYAKEPPKMHDHWGLYDPELVLDIYEKFIREDKGKIYKYNPYFGKDALYYDFNWIDEKEWFVYNEMGDYYECRDNFSEEEYDSLLVKEGKYRYRNIEKIKMENGEEYDFFMDIIKTIGRCYRGGPFMPSGFSDHYLLSFYRNGELIYWNHNLDRYFSGSDKDDTQSD